MSGSTGELDGKRILVTGASSGIGAAVSREAAEQGATCLLVARNAERLEELKQSLKGQDHRHFVRDLAQKDEITGLMEEIGNDRYPLYGLVHCAGIEKTQPFRTTTEDELDEIFAINFRAYWHLVQHFVRRGSHEKEDSRVVAIASVAGLCGAPGKTAYSASKGALIALTRSLAVEYAPKNIRFNCLCPGYVETPMLEKAKTLFPSAEAFNSQIVEKHPLGLGRPEDIAQAVTFLLGPGGRWATGMAMSFDGGYSCV
jgi:NAD(P)-dependent dehydrogenase (short-subunit alcohol dehydrogenase family)